jgi:anti-anti-sigma regulatory factor
MAIRIEKGPGKRCRAIVDGNMTIYEAAADKRVLLDAVAKSNEAEIDLSSVREMDTAGLQLLILAKRESLKEGRVMRLTGHSPVTLDVVDRYNLAAYFGDPAAISSHQQKKRRAAKTKRKMSVT